MYVVCSVNEHNHYVFPVFKLHFCHQYRVLKTLFSTFYCIFQRCTLHPSCRPTGKREKQTINHQKMPRISFSIKLWDHEDAWMKARKAVKIRWFCSKMRKLSTFPFSLSCAVESSNLLWQGLLCPKYSRISNLPFVIVVNIQIIQRKDTTRIAFSLMSWFESHIFSGIVIGVTKAPN